MGVDYCEECKRYYFVASYWYKRKCKVCSGDLIKLPIEFVDFVKLTESERVQYIAKGQTYLDGMHGIIAWSVV